MPNPTPKLTATRKYKPHRFDGISCMECGKLEDDMDIHDPGCPATTPNLMADATEAGGRFSDRLRDEREAEIRRKAFEEAAEVEKAAWRVCNAYSDERALTAAGVARVEQAVETLRVVLRARAKEQGK